MSSVGQFSLPLARPLATAHGTIDRREGFLIRVGTDQVGIGEATPLPGWTESLTECREAIEGVIGSNPPPTEPADLPELVSTPAARHGLELALLDRAAREAGVPLYRHLGGDTRVSTVPVNATVGDGDIGETATAVRRAVVEGFSAVKLKVGVRSVEEDLERVSAVRDEVGDKVELRVDANGAWSLDQAERAIDGLTAHGVTVVEQPLPATALDSFSTLRGRGVDIGVDESLRAHPMADVLAADAADVVVLKPMALGGVGRATVLAGEARSQGVDVIVTTTIDAAVARTAAVHLAAALEVNRPCGLATADRLTEDVAADRTPVVDGGISVPQSAGNGVGPEDLT